MKRWQAKAARSMRIFITTYIITVCFSVSANTEKTTSSTASLYNNLCATCHGIDGRANTDMAAQLIIKPTNFTLGEYKYGSTDESLFNIISNGSSNGMPPFDAQLKEAEIKLLVRYVRSFSNEDMPTVERIPVLKNPVSFTIPSLKKGKSLYVRYCTSCHGSDGSGDTQMREFLKTHPANLIDERWTYGNRDGDIFDVIKNGRTDSDMEAFADRLSDERIWHIINYVRYMGGKRPE